MRAADGVALPAPRGPPKSSSWSPKRRSSSPRVPPTSATSRCCSTSRPGYYMYRERFSVACARRHVGRAGHAAGQGEVRRDVPEERRDLSRRAARQRAGGQGAGQLRVERGVARLRRRRPVLPTDDEQRQISLAAFGGDGSARAGRGRRREQRAGCAGRGGRRIRSRLAAARARGSTAARSTAC